MKKIVAIVAASMFLVSFAAQAGGDGGCYGYTKSVSTPKPATSLETVSTPVTTPASAVLDIVIKPNETPKTDG